MKPIAQSDLPIANGKIYHLDIKPENLAKDIIIVGDPDRVPTIASEFLASREHEAFHRGLRTITGKTHDGLRVSILTSGMGTPSLEVVLSEVVALNELDFSTMTRRSSYEMINIIRVGTSGGLQHETALCTPILTVYGIGLDNTGLYYDAPYPDEACREIETKVRDAIDSVVKSVRFRGAISPYVSRADPTLVRVMQESARDLNVKLVTGITASNAGFFGNQGRDITRVPITVHDIDVVLGSLGRVHGDLRIENMEMEASFLLHFMTALGYRAGCICPAIANRKEETFSASYTESVKDSTRVALATLGRLRAM